MGTQDNRILQTQEPSLNIWASPLPFAVERKQLYAPVGLSIKRMLDYLECAPTDYTYTHVFIEGEYVPPHMWSRIRPKAGPLINIRVVPGKGGGGKSPLRTILMIAVIAATGFAAGALATNLALATFGGGVATAGQVALSSAAIKLAVGAVGMLLVNAIAPPPKPKMNDLSPGTSGQRDSQTLFIQGARNQAVPFGVVPVVLGTHRMFPYLAAKNFTETSGDKQYSRQLFTWGYGTSLTLSEERIGDTLLSNFQQVTTEDILDGNSAVGIGLYPDTVDETGLSIFLEETVSWQLRTTGANVDEIIVDITFPQGLVRFDSDGKRRTRIVDFEIAYAVASSGVWTTVAEEIGLSQTSAARKSFRFPVANNTYDVRLRRITVDSTSDQVFDEIFWTALRTVTYGSPVLLDGINLTAMRILATDQLNGVVDQYNAIVSNEILDWDSGGEVWTQRATSNPASIFRYLLQGPMNEKAVADGRIDLDTLQEWHDYCVLRGLEFNAVIDYETDVDSLLRDVAAAGRASLARPDGKYSVVIDKTQTNIVQMFTARNSWGYQLEKVFVDIPHAFRAQFVNKDEGYIQDEREVFADGFDGDNATDYQRLQLYGVVSADEAYIHSREHLATVILRPEVHSFFVDVENLVAIRGDRIRFAHDVISAGVGSGRIKSITDSGGEYPEAETITLDETLTMGEGILYSLVFRHIDGSQTIRNVNTVPGDTPTFTFETPFDLDFAPGIGDLCIFGERDNESLDLVIQDIVSGSQLTAKLRCVNYAPAIFTAATGPIPPFNSNITTPVELRRPDEPEIVQIKSDESVAVRNSDGSISSRMVITLKNTNTAPVTTVVKYRQTGETDYYPVTVVSATPEEIVLEGFDDGQRYDISIRYRTQDNGRFLASNIFSEEVIRTNVLFVGESGDPADVTDFDIQIIGNVAILSWSSNTDIDFDHYQINFAPSLSEVTWNTAQLLKEGIKINTVTVPARSGTYLIKAFDRSGNESQNAASVTPSAVDIAQLNVVKVITEHSTFLGGHNNTKIDGIVLQLEDAALLTGTYTFADSIDLGQVYVSKITPSVIAVGENLSDVMAYWPDLASLDALSTAAPGNWNVVVQIRTTEDDPGGSPTWSDWSAIVIGDYVFRAAEFRVVLTSLDSVTTPNVTDLSVTIDMPDRIDHADDVSVLSGVGLTVTYNPPFQAKPAIAITPKNPATGDYADITNDDRNGFTVVFRDSVDYSVEMTIDWIAKGYGKDLT